MPRAGGFSHWDKHAFRAVPRQRAAALVRIWVLMPIGARRVAGDDLGMTEQETKTILAGVDDITRSADALALATLLAPLLDAEAVAVPDRSPPHGLQRTAESQHGVMIALGASHHSVLGVLAGDSVERLTSGSPIPVAFAPAGFADTSPSLDTVAVAFDGSPESRQALAWTEALAQVNGARVRIVTVHQPRASAFPAFQGAPMVAQESALKDYRARIVNEAARELEAAGVAVQPLLLTGNTRSLLAEQSHDVDLMVTGSRGYGPARAVVLGSVSGDLVRHAGCPVVVLPRGAEVAYPANGVPEPAAAGSR
jgi:nucleotide-binding universal stress UspA family protein